MNLSAPFIRRPVATTLLTAAIVLAGAAGYELLPVAPLPQVDFPTISVSASLPGASAQIMASSVATPLERQLGQIADVTEMTSTSSLGSASVTLQFALNRDIEGAAHDVQAAINAARDYLPVNLPQNPSYRKVNPADAPIMILALTSSQYPVTRLYDLASTILAQKLSQVQGVGQVVVGGGASPAVRIEANPRQLAAYGLSMGSLSALISGENAHLARGQIGNGLVTADIITNDQISTAADYVPLVVGQHNGAAVLLSDVAQVVDSTQNLRTAGYMDGARAITLIVFRQPGANILQTVGDIRAQLGFLKAVLPAGVETTVVLDSTTMIRASVSDVERSLLISMGLVVLVTFLFLRNFRATLIPVIAVPCSLIGTLAVMYLLGYTLDNLSLMALTISTGFVLDDAIVVMDNVTRYLEAGLSPYDAAIKGAGEVGFTVMTISVSLIAVFLPILMMSGIVGRLFREFAVTVSTAIVVSMLISLTATPAMCAHLLRPETGRHGRLYRFSEGIFTGLLGKYRRTLGWVLDHPAPTLVSLALIVALNVWVMIRIPKGFFPEQDTGALQGSVRGPQDASFPYMNDAVQKLVNVIQQDPAVDHIDATLGGGSTNTGSMYIALKPLATRKIDATQVIARLRPKLNALTAAPTVLQAVQEIRIGGRSSNAMYQYTLQSESGSDLGVWAPRLAAAMKKLAGFLDVTSDQQDGGLAENVNYDRTGAARLGQTAQSLDQILYGAFGQSEASVVYTPTNQYYVVLEAAPAFGQSPAGLDDVFINPDAGATAAGLNNVAPLMSLVTAQTGTTPLQVNHTGGFPSTTISFNLGANVSLSQATAAVQGAERTMGMPGDIQGFFAGTLEAYQQSLASEPWLVATALLAVYIVLGILYESLVHPLTIISSLPSASVGAMLALLLFHIDLSVIAIIGIVLLIGIVKKNAIMMIDFALDAERAGGKSPREAILEACSLRFRPILMTTMAALFGALPLAFGTGMGAELRQPLGITIVGGLLLSQLLTLYTTPVVYLELDRLRLRALGRREVLRNAAGIFVKRTFQFPVLALSAALCGCVVGPAYHPPAPPTVAAANYKESPVNFQDADGWKVASPQDAMLRGNWWEVFNDPELNALEERLDINNQNLKQYFENFMEARALITEARSKLMPTVAIGAGFSRSSPAKAGGSDLWSIPIDASWVPDLWGTIRDQVHANEFGAQASAANLESEKLTEEAALAEYFFELRGQDALRQLMDKTVADDRQSLQLTQSRYQDGIDNQASVLQANTLLQSDLSQAVGVGLARAQFEHAMAVLVGVNATDFSLPVRAALYHAPVIPVGLPSQLLERRPDVAAAERTLAQANAIIGIGYGAFYPQLTLSAGAGLQSGALKQLFDAASRMWSIGPNLSQTIYNGGLFRAQVRQYTATYNADLAAYRQTVLLAFQQVEDGLAEVRIGSDQIRQQQAVVDSAQASLNLELSRYQTGVDPYLDVLIAETTLVQAEQNLLAFQVNSMTVAVQLVQALGGGWDRSQLPTPTAVGQIPPGRH